MKILWRFFCPLRAGIGVAVLSPSPPTHNPAFFPLGQTDASENFLQKFGFSQGGGLFFQWFHPWPKIFPCKNYQNLIDLFHSGINQSFD